MKSGAGLPPSLLSQFLSPLSRSRSCCISVSLAFVFTSLSSLYSLLSYVIFSLVSDLSCKHTLSVELRLLSHTASKPWEWREPRKENLSKIIVTLRKRAQSSITITSQDPSPSTLGAAAADPDSLLVFFNLLPSCQTRKKSNLSSPSSSRPAPLPSLAAPDEPDRD